MIVGKRDGDAVTSSSEHLDRVMNETIRRKAELFGEGSDSLYEVGTSRELTGLAIRDLSLAASSGAHVRFEDEELFLDVHASGYVPARVHGDITGIDIPFPREIAVAVNGRIAAVGGTYRLDELQRFSALVPPTAFRDGPNRVELFLVDGVGPRRKLILLGASGEEAS